MEPAGIPGLSEAVSDGPAAGHKKQTNKKEEIARLFRKRARFKRGSCYEGMSLKQQSGKGNAIIATGPLLLGVSNYPNPFLIPVRDTGLPPEIAAFALYEPTQIFRRSQYFFKRIFVCLFFFTLP